MMGYMQLADGTCPAGSDCYPNIEFLGSTATCEASSVGIIYSLKGGGFHHNPEIPWGYSPKARTASTGKPKEVAVQKDTEAA